MMRVFTADVRNGRLVIDQPAELPEGTCIELVRVNVNGGDLPRRHARRTGADRLGCVAGLAG